MRKYWLILYPDTFLWVKHNRGYIYNAKNYAKIYFENKGELAELTEVLLDLKSASNLNGNLNCSKELEHYAS